MKTIGILIITLFLSIYSKAQLSPNSEWGKSLESVQSNEQGRLSYSMGNRMKITAVVNDIQFDKMYYFDSLNRFSRYTISPSEEILDAKNAVLTYLEIMEMFKGELGSYVQSNSGSIQKVNKNNLTNREAKSLLNQIAEEAILTIWNNDTSIAALSLAENSDSYVVKIEIEPTDESKILIEQIKQINEEANDKGLSESTSARLNTKLLTDAAYEFISAGESYNAAMTLTLIGGVASSIAILNNQPALAYLSIGTSLVAVILNYVGNEHLVKGGRKMKSGISMNTSQGIGLGYAF